MNTNSEDAREQAITTTGATSQSKVNQGTNREVTEQPRRRIWIASRLHQRILARSQERQSRLYRMGQRGAR